MAIEITTRHIVVADGVKAHAREKAERLISRFPRVEHVHVILDGQRHNQLAEIVVQGKPHLRVEASEAAEGILKAIDTAADRVEKQLLKFEDKAHEHRGIGLSEASKRIEMEQGEGTP